ncbi:MAG: 4-amino-4-deoxy-L-arabinose transferase-like glycosyltransferase [Candidatus Latescibacterota bacterium]
MSRSEIGGLVLFLLFALGLRLWGVEQGYPEMYGHVDEVGVAASIWNFFRAETLLPTEFTYPALYSYLTAISLYLGVLFGWGPQQDNAIDTLVLVSYLDPARAALVGRILSALLGTATVYFTFVLGRSSYDRAVGWLAALFMALAIVPVQQAHYALPDITMAFFAILTFYGAWRIFELGNWSSYLFAGMAAGWVIASKYNGAFAALAIPTAHLMRTGLSWHALFSGRLWSAVVAAFAALFIGSPYLFLTPEKYWRLAQYQFSSLSFTMHQTQPWWWIPRDIVLLEWGLGGLMLAGVAGAIWRREKLDYILLAVWIPSFIYIGSWTRESLHYLLYCYPLLAIGAALLVREGGRRLVGRRPLIWAFVAILVVPNLYRASAVGIEMSRPDVRREAASWIETHIEDGAKIATTWLPYGPRLAWVQSRRSIVNLYRDRPAVKATLAEHWSRRPAYGLVNLEIWLKQPVVPEVYRAHIDIEDPETRRIFSRGWFSLRQLKERGVQYLVLPEAAYGRYLYLDPPPGGLSAAHYHFVKNSSYFADLIDPQNPATELVARFESSSNERGSPISIYRLR